MTLDLEEVLATGVWKKALDLKPVSSDKEDEFKEGFLIDKEPEILARGHVAENISTNRIEKKNSQPWRIFSVQYLRNEVR